MGKIDVNIAIGGILDLANKYPVIVREETEKVMGIIVSRLESEIVQKTPAGVGGVSGLRGSITGQVVPFGMSVSGNVSVTGAAIAYGYVVEFGRKAGKLPPLHPIKLWLRRKLGFTEEEANVISWPVAMKIKKKGTKGALMFTKTWEENERWVMNMLQTISGRVVRRLENGIS